MLQARERVEQMKEEKKKQIEQKFAQLDEKTEKVRAVGSGWAAVQAGRLGGFAGPWGARRRAPGPTLWTSGEACSNGHVRVGPAGQGGATG